ncbi:signal transduction histidine kinase [Luteibacter sp. OK325]|uniref:hybrid sensor histidine kinase/response regulator n=1 Tax=Luteibacter sp. OK325 TaxID=2135670 RepID=UPI000D4BF2D9|nr:ATP-binding protein [Luteibacter sp. OK325]PTR28560.1 signal transduction histidine kinase [Luteibacter sp. OK325]
MHHTLFARWILVAAVFLTVVTPVMATTPMPPVPTPQFRGFGLHEGLPSSKVKAVAQDARGFIWVATAMGLARFDGVEFIVPGIGAERNHAMPAGPLSALYIDHDDRVWIGGPDIGLARYDPVTGGFVQWRDGLSDDDVRAVTQSRDGSIWVGTSKGLDRMRPDGSGFEHLASSPDGLSSSTIRALYAADDGRVWVAGEAGVDVIDRDGQPEAVPFSDGGKPRVMRIDGSSGELHFATDAGLYRLANDGRIHPDKRVAAQHVRGSLVDSHGTVWIATLDGLSIIDRHGRPHTVADSWTAPGGLPGRTVSDMIEDREHGLWFALSDGGLAYLGPGWEDFTRFAHVATDPWSFPGRAVTAVAAHGDRELWVGGFRGWVRRFDPSTGRASGGFDLGAARVQSLLETADGRLLAGGVDGLSIASDRGAQPLFRSTIDRAVTSMAAASDGTLYVAAVGRGLFALDGALTSASAVPFVESRRGAADTRQIEMVDGELWQASVAGLARFDRSVGQMRYVEGVAPGRVSAFEPDGGGFWIVRPAALEHYVWDGNRARLQRSLGGAQGFPSADILNVRKDLMGRLWLYGQTGVWRFDPAPGSFRPFGLADGLANGEFTNATTVLLADGTMYGATLGGLVGFRPDHQRDHARRPVIVVLGATASREGTRRSLPIVDDTLHLDWNDRDLTVRSRALSYVNPERNHIDFALDHDGVVAALRTGKQGERTFGQLSPGTHHLAIYGAQRNEVDGAPVALTIIVDAPPWLRWWAWLIYVALALVLAGGGIVAARHRVRQALRLRLAEQQQRLAEEANAAKTEFMATLGHEIRTPMTGVLGMAELMAQTPLDETQRGYVDAVRHSGKTLLRLVNDALDITRIESRRLLLEVECVPLHALADEVIALTAGNAREKGLALSVRVDADVPVAIRGDTIRLRQILQNLVNNAVKFTDTGSVGLHLRRDNETLSMTVTDTGPGISDELRGRLFSRFEQGGSPQRAQGSGLGLAICHELCTLMGGHIAVESRPGLGTSFIVRLPLRTCACKGRTCAVSRSTRRTNPGRRLLLVEDDAVIADVMAGLLGQRGHQVTVVGDGLAAMAEVSRNVYDVLLLDLDLPLVDGFQVARMVRRMNKLASLPIVAVTARSAGDEMRAIRDVGMNALLRKPMTGDELDEVLDAVSTPVPEGASRIA